MSFILELSLLKPGDIVLTGDKSLASIGVKIATASKYSHAAIYVGNTLIEATLKGVFSKNIQRLIFDRENDVAVLRSKKQLSEQEIEAICSYARSKTGSLYALDEAITIRLRSTLKLDKSNRQFCSRLVAESYASIRYDFINLRNHSYCTPRQLALCKAFKEVDGVIRKATPEEIEFSQTTDPNIENQRRTFEWLDNVRALTKKEPHLSNIDIQTINDVNNFLILHPKYDSIVAAFMKVSGYLEHYNVDSTINHYRYNEKLFIFTMMQQNDPLQFIDNQLDREPEMQKRFTYMMYAYIRLLKQKNLEYFKLHLQLYINLLTEVHVRLHIVSLGVKFISNAELFEGIQESLSIVKKNILFAEKFLKELVVTQNA